MIERGREPYRMEGFCGESGLKALWVTYIKYMACRLNARCRSQLVLITTLSCNLRS